MARHTNAFPELQRDLRFVPLGRDDPQVLTPEQIDRYNADGFLFPIDIFSSDEIAEIRAYIDDLVPKALAAGWGNYDVVNWHKHCRGIWDLITEPRIIDVVSDLLGNSVVLRHSHLSADVHAYDGWNAHSVWCRGVDPRNHWANHPRPDGEHIPI
ncbi:MAG: hypothetical protein F4004_12195, partial [Acidimicrobiia bacterium]|nr:hypothetical protein [Acidimicrobiia bacterium]